MNSLNTELSPDFLQKLFNKIDTLTDIISEQTATINKQNATINKQTETINKLTETIQKQEIQIAELKEKLNKNSKNSSKPPSSDGLNKPQPKSLRKSSDKKQGAQKGHKGSGFSITQKPDDIIPHIPDACKKCSSFGKCSKSCVVAEKRYEVDVVVQTKVILHQVMSVECPKCDNEILKGDFPAHITSTMQYGQNLQALVIALNTIGMVSIHRTHEILSDLFCIPISTGTIHKMVTECAKKILPIIDVIKEKIIASPIVHFDETGTRVDNKTRWVHNASNSKYTYLTVEDKRGYEGMESSGILPNYTGIAVHDCWSSYWKYDAVLHAVCCAHLLRELTGVKENHPTQVWASKMIELLLDMKKQRDKAVFMSKDGLSYYYTHKFHQKYQSIIEEARELNPIPEKVPGKRGRQGKGKIRALIERLFDYEASVCLFTKNFNVPFDNNQAERDVRMIKVKTKVAGCFRTLEGAQNFMTIMSYLGTAKKHGISPMKALRKALSDEGDFIFA